MSWLGWHRGASATSVDSVAEIRYCPLKPSAYYMLSEGDTIRRRAG